MEQSGIFTRYENVGFCAADKSSQTLEVVSAIQVPDGSMSEDIAANIEGRRMSR